MPDAVFHVESKQHWERIYSEKSPGELSWYAPRLESSLSLIQRAGIGFSDAILDVGGGASTLPDELLRVGYRNITVLDIAESALEQSRRRLGSLSTQVRWLAADVTSHPFEAAAFAVWHDRAVFHFLTDASDRAAYVRQVARALRAGGNLVLSTFGPEGPTRCSGLDAVRYDAASLQREFGEPFRLVESLVEEHHTPAGKTQQFLYCRFRFDSASV